MANVLFKQGTQSALNQIRTAHSATAGTFYLTSDNHKLYIGVEGGDAVPVNEGVTTVEQIENLPKATYLNAGEFYYVSAANVLCIYNGTQWVQINANTNTYVTDLDIDVTVNANGVASIKTSLMDSGGSTYVDTYKIEGANGTVVSANSLGDGIVVTGDSYELSESYNDITKMATISLTSQNTENDTSIGIEAGDNITFLQHANHLEIRSSDTTLDSGASGYGASAIDSSGTGFYVQATDTKGNQATAAIDPTIMVGSEPTYQRTLHFSNGLATLPVYTIDEINRKFVGLDAMSYKGTLGSSGAFGETPTSGVQCGDTYLIANNGSPFTVAVGVIAQHGDMIIARGTEVSGEITSGTLTWDVVPSGDDAAIDTNYTIVPSTNGFILRSSSGSDVGNFRVNGDGTYLTVSESQGTNSNTVTVRHMTVTPLASDAATSTVTAASQLPTGSVTIPAVTKVSRDAAGHVTGVEVTDFELTDTNSAVDSVEFAAAVDGNLATVTSSVTTKSSNGNNTTKTGAFGINSESLTVTAAGATVTVDLAWGTF